ncbi:helix-turn-helix transcriptional regulator [Micromonospora sp. NPDC000663]|uniref:helix-turn-helix domain-containing protein n=1 Tax=Micromonospora sp. NPDC000663 TaxID=3364218 RepID=UPI0036958A95
MITVPAQPGAAGARVRVAISSPEILAHIRHEFASKGLDAHIDGLPSVDVVVTPRGDATPATGALAGALNELAGPHTRQREPATARYRLGLVPRVRRPSPTLGGNRAPAGGTSCTHRHPSLSRREAEVMDSISRGMRNADIAALLRIREKTVKNHVNRIFTKLGARTRIEAVLIWQRERVAG